MGSPTRFAGLWVRQFVVLPLLHVVSASIPFFVSLVVVDFFFFFFRGEKGCRGFFSKEEEEETKLFGFLLWNLSVQNSISR